MRFRALNPLAARSDSGGEGLDRATIIVAAVVVIGAFMSILDTTIVNVALATLSHELHSPLDEIQWVATGYLVALAVVIPLTGWASERFGAKRLWMTVVALFVAGSALSGLAWSADSLIFFRVLQGLGGGMIMPAGMTILAQAAGPKRVGRVMSIVGVPMLLGPVFGPVIGGLILQNLSWNWIFYVNAPIGIAALVLGHRLLPRSAPQPRDRLDLRGLALLSPGLAAIVYGLSETSSAGGIAYVGSWAPIVAGIALVAGFAWHALHIRDRAPLLDLGLFRAPGFAAASVLVLLVGAAIFGALFVLPLYFQVARGASTLTTGLLLAPQGIGAALVMPISGRLTDKIGGGIVSLFGLLVMTLASVALTALTARTSYSLTSAILVIRGVGLGSCMMPATAAAYAALTRRQVPQATTAINVFQRVGGSIGTALLAVVLEDQIRTTAPGALTDGSVAPLAAAVRSHLAAPLATAFDRTLWLAVALSAVAAIPALVLAVKQRGAASPAPSARSKATGRAAQIGVRPAPAAPLQS